MTVIRALLSLALFAIPSLGAPPPPLPDPPILLLTADDGTPVADVFRTYGSPEIRSVRLEGETRLEDLAYRINEGEMVIARFVDGALAEVRRAKAREKAPPPPNLSTEQLVRRGRTISLRLGWTAEQAAAWLPPDAVLAEEAARASIARWPGGELWIYRTGPYVTYLRVAGGRVIELSDRLGFPPRDDGKEKVVRK